MEETKENLSLGGGGSKVEEETEGKSFKNQKRRERLQWWQQHN